MALARARARAARAPRAPFVVLLLVLMASGLLCLLLLNTALSEDAFRAHGLQVKASALANEEQGLELRANQQSAPEALASRAAELGMVQGGLPQWLPPGATLPPGARVVAGGDVAGGGVFYVVPAPAKPAATAAPSAPAQPAGSSPAGGASASSPRAGEQGVGAPSGGASGR